MNSISPFRSNMGQIIGYISMQWGGKQSNHHKKKNRSVKWTSDNLIHHCFQRIICVIYIEKWSGEACPHLSNMRPTMWGSSRAHYHPSNTLNHGEPLNMSTVPSGLTPIRTGRDPQLDWNAPKKKKKTVNLGAIDQGVRMIWWAWSLSHICLGHPQVSTIRDHQSWVETWRKNCVFSTQLNNVRAQKQI